MSESDDSCTACRGEKRVAYGCWGTRGFATHGYSPCRACGATGERSVQNALGAIDAKHEQRRNAIIQEAMRAKDQRERDLADKCAKQKSEDDAANDYVRRLTGGR